MIVRNRRWWTTRHHRISQIRYTRDSTEIAQRELPDDVPQQILTGEPQTGTGLGGRLQVNKEGAPIGAKAAGKEGLVARVALNRPTMGLHGHPLSRTGLCEAPMGPSVASVLLRRLCPLTAESWGQSMG